MRVFDSPAIELSFSALNKHSYNIVPVLQSQDWGTVCDIKFDLFASETFLKVHPSLKPYLSLCFFIGSIDKKLLNVA